MNNTLDSTVQNVILELEESEIIDRIIQQIEENNYDFSKLNNINIETINIE